MGYGTLTNSSSVREFFDDPYKNLFFSVIFDAVCDAIADPDTHKHGYGKRYVLEKKIDAINFIYSSELDYILNLSRLELCSTDLRLKLIKEYNSLDELKALKNAQLREPGQRKPYPKGVKRKRAA